MYVNVVFIKTEQKWISLLHHIVQRVISWALYFTMVDVILNLSSNRKKNVTLSYFLRDSLGLDIFINFLKTDMIRMVIIDISDMDSKPLDNLETTKLKSDLFQKEGDENNNNEGLNKEEKEQRIDCTLDQTFAILISEDYFVEDEEDEEESEYNIYSEETFEILISEDYFIEDDNNNEDREEIQGDISDDSSESEDEDDMEDSIYSDKNEDDCGHYRNNQTQESDVTLPAAEEDRL